MTAQSRFWTSTPEQRRALLTLVLLLVVIVAKSISRGNRVRTDRVEIVIPHLRAFVIILHPPVRSSRKIGLYPTLFADVDAWQSAVKIALNKRGFKRTPVSQTKLGTTGTVHCLEVSDERGKTGSSSFEPVHGLLTSFEGSECDLESSYSIVRSTVFLPG